jgi:phosphoglycerol geranylgeranyltransferase
MKFDKHINTRKQSLAVLIDPDKYNPELIDLCRGKKVAFFLVGGSKLHKGNIRHTVLDIKKRSRIPVILFPGDETQLCSEADGLLVLSLLSGRNPEYLISKHVKAAPLIKKFKLKTFPVAYVLVGNHHASTTAKVTHTSPMNVWREVVHTALAAEQLGFKAVYLEAGSGSGNTVSKKILTKVSEAIGIPVIAGGGIKSTKNLKSIFHAGAHVAVVGNALETNPKLILQLLEVFE